MSPFSYLLAALRRDADLRQSELAKLIGYEQSYVSALEVGSKGPPTEEFVEKLISVLALSQDEAVHVREAVDASQRKIQIPSDAPESVFRLCHELRQQIAHLHPLQIEAILATLRLSASLKAPAPSGAQKFRCRKASAGEKEAPM